jgi:hypothetical protein
MSPNGTEMEEDPRLDAWIRAARRPDEGSDVSPEIVHAYLSGTATAEQKTLMRRALASSAEFRAQVLQMSEHLEALQTMDAVQAYEQTVAPELQRQAQHDWMGAFQRAMEAVGDFFAELTTPRRLAFALPAAAAVVLLIVAVPRLGRLPEIAPSGVTVVDTQRFTGAATRGEATSHRDAADIELERNLVVRDGVVRLERGVAPPTGSTGARVRLLAASGERLREIELPAVAGDETAFEQSVEAGDAVAWLLVLPDGAPRAELRQFPIPKSAFALRWPDGPRRGVLTVTYPTPDGYASTPCVEIDLDRPDR